MATNNLKQAQERWKQLSETIQNMSTINAAETKATQIARIERARKDYAYLSNTIILITVRTGKREKLHHPPNST